MVQNTHAALEEPSTCSIPQHEQHRVQPQLCHPQPPPSPTAALRQGKLRRLPPAVKLQGATATFTPEQGRGSVTHTVHCSWLKFSCAFQQNAFKFSDWSFGFFCFVIIKSLTFRLSKYIPHQSPCPRRRKPCVWRRHCFSDKTDLATKKDRFLCHVEHKQRPSPCGADSAEKGLI